jgi:putative SOS response-associated peptidase YedK
MFKPLWQHGRAICFADAIPAFEGRAANSGHKYRLTILALDEVGLLFLSGLAEGFLLVTAAADRGLVDIHDRRPLVLAPEAAREISTRPRSAAAVTSKNPSALSPRSKGVLPIAAINRPLVLAPEAAREWMRQEVTDAEAVEIARDGAVTAEFILLAQLTLALDC